MKKIFLSLLAIAALTACSKSDVQYSDPAEIGFAPVSGNITKAAGKTGNLDESQKLGIWAYWDNDVETTDGVVETPAYADYTDNYLVNALFAKKGTSWGGDNVAYPWPVNGALVFSGYTTPNSNVLDNVTYNLSDDKMTFTSYSNTNEFDLCWFGRTASAYNYRAAGTAVPVSLSHALSWVSIAVYGDGVPVGNWTITSMSLNKVASAGTAICDGATKKATWKDVTIPTTAKSIYSGNHLITAGVTADGKTTGTKLTDNVLIPSNDVELTVNYSFKVGEQVKTDSKTITLNTTIWESGVHYTYTLVFKGNEILVAPSYGEWGTSDQTITVE